MVKVFRSGQSSSISVEDLVVGDIYAFQNGMKVPADSILIEGENIECDEGALSGESDPEKKRVLDDESLKQGAKATLFAQTVVTMGSGKAMVIAVGISTKAGQI